MDKMTREEAIEILNRDDDSMRKGYFCINDFRAIEVLKSEESILDKIRAEIDKARFIDKDTRICKNALASGLEVAMQIIDKYKAECEPQESEDKE